MHGKKSKWGEDRVEERKKMREDGEERGGARRGREKIPSKGKEGRRMRGSSFMLCFFINDISFVFWVFVGKLYTGTNHYSGEGIFIGLVVSIGFMLSILFHEMSHGWAMYYIYGIQVRVIILHILGMYCMHGNVMCSVCGVYV